ncbi:MAG TPA: PAS domain S-box protein, partial [Bacteroidota bacterium]
DMLGYSPGELEGKVIEDVVFPKDIAEDRKNLQEMVAGNLVRYQLEKRYLRKDGGIAWGALNATAIRSSSGEFLYSLRLVEDITRKREAEQQIHMLAHTVTSMNECVIICDTNYRILSVNIAFLRTFGFEESEILGLPVSALRAPDATRAQLRSVVEGTLTGGWTGELMVSRKNGEVFSILLSTSVVREEKGNPVALVGIARDITEQKRLQHRLEEAERKRLEDLRRFAINVQRAQEEERQRISRELHDDICQRLSGMKLNMEVFEDEVRNTDRKIYRALRSFRKQFEQTITEVRRMSSNLRPTVLDDFGLTIAINLLTREFEKAQKIKVKVETGDPSLRHLDPQVEIALYRIAQESMANIAKHSGASQVTLSLRQHEHEVELIVADNGKGFEDVDALQARKEGHGLGLISMRERAELLGGTCVIESAKDRGTTIHVTIPLEAHANHEEN